MCHHVCPWFDRVDEAQSFGAEPCSKESTADAPTGWVFVSKFPSLQYPTVSGWWFGTFFIFPYIGNHHPNWLIFFRGVETTNQVRSMDLMQCSRVSPENIRKLDIPAEQIVPPGPTGGSTKKNKQQLHYQRNQTSVFQETTCFISDVVSCLKTCFF